MMKVIINASKKALWVVGLVVMIFAFVTIEVKAQENTSNAQMTDKKTENKVKEVESKKTDKTKTEPTPLYTNYRGVAIGMSADETREILGKPKEKNKKQDFYIFSGKESAQILYNNEGKIKTISVTYFGDDSHAPSPVDVLGQELEVKANGSMYRMVRYSQAGYWVSYSRTAGDKPIISITMQKMRVIKK